jgi:hypothetical protein
MNKPRKPRDFDAELQALSERTKKLKGQKTVQLGELVQATDADTLPVEALAGVLLAAVEQAKKQPEVIARWTERGHAFFQASGRRRGKSANATNGADEPVGGTASYGAAAPAPGG